MKPFYEGEQQQFEIFTTPSRTTFVLEGDTDPVVSQGLADFAYDEIKRPGLEELVFDFTHAESIESTAMGVLVGSLKRLRRQQKTLRVVASEPVKNYLENLAPGLPRMFNLELSGAAANEPEMVKDLIERARQKGHPQS